MRLCGVIRQAFNVRWRVEVESRPSQHDQNYSDLSKEECLLQIVSEAASTLLVPSWTRMADITFLGFHGVKKNARTRLQQVLPQPINFNNVTRKQCCQTNQSVHLCLLIFSRRKVESLISRIINFFLSYLNWK